MKRRFVDSSGRRIRLAVLAADRVSGFGKIAPLVATILAPWQARKVYSIPSFVLMIPVIFARSPGSHGLWLVSATVHSACGAESSPEPRSRKEES